MAAREDMRERRAEMADAMLNVRSCRHGGTAHDKVGAYAVAAISMAEAPDEKKGK